uniref:Uncharacterized protein n=1 Tax=Acrobeloides nanus TaxID=290746 RepID=A0A914EML3_9BILA
MSGKNYRRDWDVDEMEEYAQRTKNSIRYLKNENIKLKMENERLKCSSNEALDKITDGVNDIRKLSK